MPQAFIIMQIGNKELDAVCENSIVPAIESCGFEPKRVDKHNEGGLLKSEIIKFINESDIIVADITNERPNCYLEIGYAMGIDKFPNLIITVREDHLPSSPNHKKNGPKVHFDLSGYDLLRWSTDDLEGFRTELEKRIRRRHAIIRPTKIQQESVWDDEWLEAQHSYASPQLQAAGYTGGMLLKFTLEHPKLNVSQQILDDAARAARIQTFGWPIGVYLGQREEARPRPRADGIYAEIHLDSHHSYDYWAIKKTGEFYSLMSYFEDNRRENEIFFNTRIVRVTEALLYCARLYLKLNVDRSSTIHLIVGHTGLTGRTLTAVGNRSVSIERKCYESESHTEIVCRLEEIESNLVNLVKSITAPLFMLFEYFELSDEIYEDIIDKFLKGKVT